MNASASNNSKIASATISQVSLKKPRFLPETTLLSECSKVMREEKETFLIFQNDRGQTVGIFTERDMVLCYWSPEIRGSTPVMAVMNRKFVTIDEKSSIQDAVDLLGSNEISQVPVLGTGGEVKGVLTVEHLLDNFRETFPRDLLNLSPTNQFPQQRVGG